MSCKTPTTSKKKENIFYSPLLSKLNSKQFSSFKHRKIVALNIVFALLLVVHTYVHTARYIFHGTVVVTSLDGFILLKNPLNIIEFLSIYSMVW